MALLRLIGQLINIAAGFFSRSALRDLNRLYLLYAGLEDDELRAELRRVHAAGRDITLPSFRMLSRFKDSPMLHALAIGSCLFDRHPCDLPAGSRAYDEQKLAALMLIDGINVQMDTGEGKTYSIALAATALLVMHPQVLVITANGYLADRDHARVSGYFGAAGIACVRGVPAPDFRGVAYTTMGGICFGYLNRVYRDTTSTWPDYPGKAAIVIDEIDSVLLDQTILHNIVRILPSDEILWESVFRLADSWDDSHYTHDPVSGDFSLTADSWEEVAALSRQTGKPMSLLMTMAAGALWARHAEPGRHYLEQDGAVHLINQITGQPFDEGTTRQNALEYRVAGKNPPVSLRLAEIDGLTLLRRHPLVVGLSGTARDDTLFYLQQLRSLTGQVPPRFPRYHGKVRTLVAISREATFGYLAQRIEEVQPRPVIIGTWSPADAREVADWLVREQIVNPAHLGVITTLGSLADAAVLDVAGQPGRVTVLSQGGSRGVDVRSEHRPLLIVLGRAVEPRLDRQFLGRVGRHGEPFDAEFIIDPGSPVQLPLSIISKLVGDVMPLRGAAARGANQRQRDMWAYRVRRRQQATVLARAQGEVEAAVAAEFAQIRAVDGGEGMREFATVVCAKLTEGASQDQAGAVLTQVRSALGRRQRSDEPVIEFSAAMNEAFGDDANAEWRPSIVTGDPAELRALSRWLREGTERVRDAEESAVRLFRNQAELAGTQRLASRTTPHWRSPADIITETRLMANATMLEQIRHRLETLWVTSTHDSYYRRGAFMVRGLHELCEQSVRREMLTNLSLADDPGQLDELYYSSEHRISRPSSGEDLLAPYDQTPPPPAETLSHARAELLVAEYIDAHERQPGGMAVPPDAARLLLLDVLRPLMVGSAVLSVALLRQRVNLMLDSLAAKGTRGARLRDHKRLIFDFTDGLHRQGILSERLTPQPAIVGVARRARTFIGTIPRFGLLAVAGYLGVFAVGALPVIGTARTWGFAQNASQLFGFGLALPGRPLLSFFALLVILQATTRACGFSDPQIFTIRVSPILGVVIALTLYDRGLANIGLALAMIPLLGVWAMLLFTAQRYVLTLIGTDANAILTAASVAVYLVQQGLHGHLQASALVLVGVLAVVAGPAVPVSIAGRQYGAEAFQYADDRARVRIALDPSLVSALLAVLLVGVMARVHGMAAAAGFALVQLTVLTVLTVWRLSPDKIKGLLAGLQIGTPLTDDQLHSYLRRAVGRSVLIAAAVLAGAVTLAVRAANQPVTQFLLQEWAGCILLTGVLALAGAMSVAGAATPLLTEHSGDETLRARLRGLREQFRAYRRMRFAWVWKLIVTLLVVTGILRWIHDWIGVADVSRMAWDLLHRLAHLL